MATEFLLCCAGEGCRRRTTPVSVRFFARRVYLGALVLLVTALSQGLTGRRRERLRKEFGLSARTLRRWHRWWREVFALTRWWRGVGGRFMAPVAVEDLPASLLARFGQAGERNTVIAALRFVAALSIDSEHAH